MFPPGKALENNAVIFAIQGAKSKLPSQPDGKRVAIGQRKRAKTVTSTIAKVKRAGAQAYRKFNDPARNPAAISANPIPAKLTMFAVPGASVVARLVSETRSVDT